MEAQKKRGQFRFVPPVETFVPLADPAPKRPDAFVVEGKRLDGRSPDEFRPVFLKTGVISQAAGSAYIEMNQTKVICGVYGPRQTPKTVYSEKGKLNCFFKLATFAENGERRKYVSDKEEKELSMLMVQALEVSLRLETFPKSELDVFVLVLEESGGMVGAAITAASLALADAGIEMYDLVASCSVGVVDSHILLDPSIAEEKAAQSNLMVAIMPSANEITQMLQTGEIEHTKAPEAIELCLDGCSKIYQMMRQNLLETAAQKLSMEEAQRTADK
ncbi:3' exoribonuclease family, domain 1 domain containing protein [Acanthamoeba castellanii str. Neff]|uniref:3' exoribonuclease family, domain 1 domain containing protein n=1 Tax=Acanthamoeba castellanii (strain ATCC 30010 / Neff) TaxID=1257118 RepID=L8HCU8_ACACF|nr:3' exoribonuclease family, domain 1 domain containing protein [Acanthamoeba castellanii str. Neff]ELR23015.1 3' exoribonuclease family, domain 1 domain containing protein [Acanthamoeba castellanii str. Neff]